MSDTPDTTKTATKPEAPQPAKAGEVDKGRRDAKVKEFFANREKAKSNN